MGGSCLTPLLCYAVSYTYRKIYLVISSRALLLCFIQLLRVHWPCKSFQSCWIISHPCLDPVCLFPLSGQYNCWVLIRLTGRIPSRIYGHPTCRISLWRDWYAQVGIVFSSPDKYRGSSSNKDVMFGSVYCFCIHFISLVTAFCCWFILPAYRHS